MSNEAAILARLQNTLARALKVDPGEIGVSSPMKLRDWDSLNFLVVIYAVEREFGIVFDRKELTTFQSVEDLVRAIQAKQR